MSDPISEVIAILPSGIRPKIDCRNPLGGAGLGAGGPTVPTVGEAMRVASTSMRSSCSGDGLEGGSRRSGPTVMGFNSPARARTASLSISRTCAGVGVPGATDSGVRISPPTPVTRSKRPAARSTRARRINWRSTRAPRARCLASARRIRSISARPISCGVLTRDGLGPLGTI